MIDFKLFQVKNHLTREYGYLGLSFLRSAGREVDLENYDLVYEGSIGVIENLNALESLFRIFNLEHPNDFIGRSMSVSDVVQLGNKYFYCDSIGWTEIKFK